MRVPAAPGNEPGGLDAQQMEQNMHDPHEPPPREKDIKSMGPQFLVGGTAVAAMIIAIVVLVWSPWDEDSAATSEEQIARPTPAAAGTPRP
jgi:hypothetical protein